MIEVLLIAGGALALSCAAGLCVLLLLAPERRGWLLPAVPALGIVALVLLLSLTGTVLPISVSVWIAVGLLLALGTIGALRHRSLRLGSRRHLLAALSALIVGVGCLFLVILPVLFAQQPTMVQTGQSYDGFYYVSVADWLTGHTIFDAPELGTEPGALVDSPAFGPAMETFSLNLRVGQESVVAGLAILLGRSPVEVQFVAMGLWAALVPGGAVVLARSVGLKAPAGLVLGALVVVSLPFLAQAIRPNSDSVLGIALVILLLGGVVGVMNRSAIADGPPRWLTGAMFAAVVGTYTEYLPFLVAVLAAITLVGPVRSLVERLLAAAMILGFAVLLAPVIWWRAVLNTLFLIGYSSSGAPPSTDSRWAILFAPIHDTIALMSSGSTARALLVVGAVGVIVAVGGFVGALIFRRSRGLAVGGLLAVAAGIVVTRSAGDYVVSRTVDMITPILLCGSVLGAALLGNLLLQRIPIRVPRAIGATVAGVLVAVIVAAFVVPASRFAVSAAEGAQVVGPEFADARAWAKNGPVAVAAPVLFDQLWLSQALHALPEVEYLALRGDLGYRANRTLREFGDGQGVRAVILGPGAFHTADATVLEKSGRFALVQAGSGVLAAPFAQTGKWNWVPLGESAIAAHGADSIQLLGTAESIRGACLRFSGLGEGTRMMLTSAGASVSASASAGVAEVALTGLPVNGTDTKIAAEVEGDTDASFVWEGFCVR